ncbi:response regulator [Enterovibrio makurazakiensis]|uniref:response regulator n=1 Tax=Enterovibrio makurazakiensis TaxID=2910232 RepID=UPI003D252587
MTPPKVMNSTQQLASENEQLRQEIDALYAAAEAREQQLLAATHAMDEILLEMETQRNALKRKNKQLLELNAYIRSINDAMNSMLVVVGVDGLVTQTNRVFTEDLGWTDEELPDIHIDSLFPHSMLTNLSNTTADTQESKVVSTITQSGHLELEMPLIRCNGELTHAVYLVKGEQFYSHQGKLQGILLTATDISELRQREVALKQSEIALQKAKAEADAANQAKGDFLANMSHEIRTPLNAIIGFTKLCLHSNLSTKQRGYLNTVDVASHSLSHLINDVLDLSKIEAGKLTMENVPFNLHQVLSNVRHVMWFDVSKRGLTFDLLVDDDVNPLLKGDPLRLQQVLVNVVGNAIKFTDHGSVSVTVKNKDTNNIDKESDNPTRPQSLQFQINDTGIGMTAPQLDRLFNKYHQADPSTTRRFGGTGLGLSISEKLVNLMNGDIQIQSIYGEGTQVTFYACFESVSDSGQTDVPLPQPSDYTELPNVNELSGARVLVVDDNAINREMIKELLSSLGMWVEQASSGQQALEAIESHLYSVILMDLSMTNMDGIETTQALRKLDLGKKVPVIALSANTSENILETCLNAGMNDYLPKPIDFQRLIQVIANHMTNQQEIGDQVFQPEHALQRLGFNYTVYNKMLKRFVDQTDQRLQTLQEAHDSRDLAVQKHIFHELKGITATLGADKLSMLCGSLEAKCQSVSVDEETLFEVVSAYLDLTNELTEYLKTHS